MDPLWPRINPTLFSLLTSARCEPLSVTDAHACRAEPDGRSGEPAKFLAGGKYPVSVVDSLGQVSVVYKE